MPEKTEDSRPPNELLLIALLLKVGGHSVSDAEVERAKTHTLTTKRVVDEAGKETGETELGAIPVV